MSVFDIDIVYVIALIGIVCVFMVIVFVKSDDRAIPDPEQKIDTSNVFILETEKCKIKFSDPFDNFLIYGGANSGKTKSIGKPLLSNYISIIRQSKSTRFPIKKYKNGTCFSRPVFCIPFTPRKGAFSPLLIVYFTSWKVVE